MDRKVYQTDVPFYLDTEDNGDGNKTTTSLPVTSWENVNGHETIWTEAIIFRVSTLSVLMLLTFLGNMIVIITIISCGELRMKRVNVFILNLAVGDLMVCFVSMSSHILLLVMNQWLFGPIACRLAGYCYVVAVAFPTFLLTAMSTDIYQVRTVSDAYLVHLIHSWRYKINPISYSWRNQDVSGTVGNSSSHTGW